MFALYLARTLGSGVATIGPELAFSRAEEPREYWALASLAAAGVAICLPWFGDTLRALGMLEFL